MANKKVSQLTSKPAVNLTDLFLIADPTSGQAFKTTISDLGTAIGSGVSSVNTLVGAVVLDTDDIQELASPTNRWFTDTRARAALSASSPLAYNSGTGVFSIPAATSSQNGYLTSTDWTTFNAKQQALSGTGFVKISGTTISYDNSTYLTTSAAASTYLALAGGTLTGALNGTSANFSGDLTLTGTNPRFYLTDSDNNPDYFISNTDGTFTVYDVTNSTSRFTIGTTGNGTFGGNLTVGQIIRSGGTSSQFLKADGSVDSSTYLTTGTASSTYLPLGGGTMTGVLFGASASFSGFVGFGGNTSPLAAIDVTGAGIFSSSVRSSGYYLTGMTSGSGALYYNSGANRVTVANYNASGIVAFEVNGGSTALTLNSNLSATFASTLSATGATLTGALSGTSASFSSSVTGLKYIANSQATYASMTYEETIKYSSSPAGIWFGNSFNSNNNVALQLRTSNDGTSVQALTLASTGAATFSSSVTASGKITSGPGAFRVGGFYIPYGGSTASRTWAVTNDEVVFGDFNILTSSTQTGDVNTTRFYINPSGNVGIGTTAPNRNLDINGNLRVQNGAIDLSNDFNNQIYSLSNAFYVKTNGSERLTITSSGFVGIRTTSPGNALTVTSPNAYIAEFYRDNNADSRINLTNTTTTTGTDKGLMLGEIGVEAYFYNYANGPAIFGTNSSERMRITSGGNVGIGTTSPVDYTNYRSLHISGATSTSSAILYLSNSTSSIRGLFFAEGSASRVTIGSQSNHDFTFLTNDTERMRITSGGFLLLGNTTHTDGSMFQNSGSNTPLNAYRQSTGGSGIMGFYSNQTSDKNVVAYFKCDGGLANYSANNVNLSDERTKNSIVPMESYWDKFKAINIVKFKYNGQSHDDYNIGVIAQQVESVAPEFVCTDGWGVNENEIKDLKSIYESDLHHATIGVLKEAMAKIETLEAEIQTLKNK